MMANMMSSNTMSTMPNSTSALPRSLSPPRPRHRIKGLVGDPVLMVTKLCNLKIALFMSPESG
jgi:hypothetical protein